MCDKFSEGTQEGCDIGWWRVGTTVCKNWHAIKFANRGEGVGMGGVILLRSEVGFHVEGNSSSSFAGGTAVAGKNVTWETNFLVFEFVM